MCSDLWTGMQFASLFCDTVGRGVVRERANKIAFPRFYQLDSCVENGVPSRGQSTSVRLVVWQTGCSWTCIRNAGRARITYRRIDFFRYGEVPCLRGLKGIRVDASGEVERIRGDWLRRKSWFKREGRGLLRETTVKSTKEIWWWWREK